MTRPYMGLKYFGSTLDFLRCLWIHQILTARVTRQGKMSTVWRIIARRNTEDYIDGAN
jgi:hypothetical protein